MTPVTIVITFIFIYIFFIAMFGTFLSFYDSKYPSSIPDDLIFAGAILWPLFLIIIAGILSARMIIKLYYKFKYKLIIVDTTNDRLENDRN